MPTFDTPGPISVTVELGAGDVRVVASDRTDTVVDVQPSDPGRPTDVAAAEQTRIELVDDALVITAPKGRRRYSLRGPSESIDVRVELPTGSQLDGDTGVAGLRVAGTLGAARYKTGAGDITVEQVTGTVELRTGTGTIRVGRAGGNALIRSGNGDTWVGEAGGDLQVKAANGAISVDQAGADVSAKTANGNIHLDEVVRGAVVAETACGTVDVAVLHGVAAWLDLHTGFGHVRNALDAGAEPGPSESTVEVRARTSFGDITIRRSGARLAGRDSA